MSTHPDPTQPSRRQLATGAAWTIPAVLLAAPAPAFAASGCALAISTAGLGNNGYDLYLRDGKKQIGVSVNTSPTNTLVLQFVLTYTCGGVGQSGVAVSVAGDSTTDGQGNYMIGFWDTSAPSGTYLTQSSTQAVANLVTNSSGQVSVRVSTATYSLDACPGGIPRSGTWTVTVGGNTWTYTYLIYDGAVVVNCP